MRRYPQGDEAGYIAFVPNDWEWIGASGDDVAWFWAMVCQAALTEMLCSADLSSEQCDWETEAEWVANMSGWIGVTP